VRIDVTQEDINAGVPRDSCRCPIAHAIDRAIGSTSMDCVSVNAFKVSVWRDERRLWSALTPPDLIDFIKAFDHDRDVKPFSFDLDLPGGEVRG
jgi:hypothetical protein